MHAFRRPFQASDHVGRRWVDARLWLLKVASTLLVMALSAVPAEAQNRARAWADGGVRVTRVADAVQTLVGGRLWFSVSDSFRFGGGAWALPRAAQNGTLSGSGFEMDFGYGGVGVEWSVPMLEHLALRAMFGAGSGTILDRATGARVDSETFMLLEPELVALHPITGWLKVTGAAGYRLTFDAGDLARVQSGDLRSWILSVGLRAGF